MLIWIWTRDDETGLLDDEFRDGDIFKTEPDSFEGSIGGIEKKTKLILKVPDPPNYSKVADSLVLSEFAPADSASADPVIRRKRIYRLNWRTHFDAAEIALIESSADTLPDGALDSGGTVTAGVVSDKFVFTDFSRK
jgi:hypothetical protein